MISTGAAWQLGELAPLAEVGQRLRAAYGGMPTAMIVSATGLITDDCRNVQNTDEQPRIPVLTGGAEFLPWAVAATAMLLESDVAELVPDRFMAEGHLDHTAWSALCAQARDVMAASRHFAHRPTRAPDEVPDPGLIALKRFMIDNADAGAFPVVLLDGPVPAAAALLADAAQPGSTAALMALQPGTSRLEAAVYERLGIESLLPWRTNCPDGSLAALAIEIIDSAVAQSQRLAPDSMTA